MPAIILIALNLNYLKLLLQEMPGFCEKCLTNYKGTLDEHIANLHILDFPQTAGYIAYLEKRIEALENKINTQKLN